MRVRQGEKTTRVHGVTLTDHGAIMILCEIFNLYDPVREHVGADMARNLEPHLVLENHIWREWERRECERSKRSVVSSRTISHTRRLLGLNHAAIENRVHVSTMFHVSDGLDSMGIDRLQMSKVNLSHTGECRSMRYFVWADSYTEKSAELLEADGSALLFQLHDGFRTLGRN